jgi:hypothetical protein
LFLVTFLGVAIITTARVATFSERSFFRGFPYFRGFIPGDRLCWILFPGFVVTLYIAAPAPVLACVALVGSAPSTVGSSSETSASSTVPWMKRMSGKKEPDVVHRAPSISFEDRVFRMVVSGAFGVAPVQEAHASLH